MTRTDRRRFPVLKLHVKDPVQIGGRESVGAML